MKRYYKDKLEIMLVVSVFLFNLCICFLNVNWADAEVIKLAAVTESGGSGPATKLAFEIANKKFEGSIFVDVVSYTWESAIEKTVAELVAKGTNFDLINAHTIYGGGIAKYLEDLRPYVKQSNVKLDGIPVDLLEKSSVYQGRLIGLPFRVGINSMFVYRKDLYNKYNLKVPKTMEEYYHNAKVITEGEKANGIYGAALMSGKNVGVYEDFFCWFLPQGGRLLNEKEDGLVPFESPSGKLAVDILKMWKKMHDEGLLPPGHTTWWHTDALNAMCQGIVAQRNSFNPYINILNDPTKSKTVGKWDYTLWFNGNERGGYSSAQFGVCHSWGINGFISPKKKEAAFKVLATMISEETQTRAALERANGPTISKIYVDAEYKKSNPAALQVNEALKKFFTYRLPEQQELITIIGEEGGAAIIGQKSAEAAAKAMWTRTEALLKK